MEILLIFKLSNNAIASPGPSGQLVPSSAIIDPLGIRGRKLSIATFDGL